MSVAHNVEVKLRTEDVHISESITFAELLLSDAVLDGLTKAGFKRPSPIQLKAIPMGRCGLDLIVQAKSGTGKTCVFSVIALEGIDVASDSAQVLVLAPTREIALQISSVIQTLGISLKGLATCSFIGGTPLLQDKTQAKKCHIAVGTPGRVKQLIELGALRTGSLRLLVLDEADKLLAGDFTEVINWIYSMLPDNKQILACSATYPEYMANELTKYMRNPTFIRLNISDPALIGIKQYHHVVPSHHLPNKVFDYKTEAIIKILSSVSFQQCLIFSNLQSRAQSLRDDLQARNWPAVCIAGCLDQKERNFAIDQLKTYQCRILISTDLTARGIDADRVNLVINLDVPYDHETYLHRIGRAGRFGSFGAAISIVSKGGQDRELWMVEKKCKTHISELPDPIPKDLVDRKVEIKLSDIVSAEKIVTCEQGNSDPMVFESNSESFQAYFNECHSEPPRSQPLFSSRKDKQEKVVQQHKHSSNFSHKFEQQEGSSSEICENEKVNIHEICDSPGLVYHHMEMNNREISHEHGKPIYGKEDSEITNQKLSKFPTQNGHVDADPQSTPQQTCSQEECGTNSADTPISENGKYAVSPVKVVTPDSKMSKDVQKTQSEMFGNDSASSHCVLLVEVTDLQTVNNASPLSQRVHSARQDVSESTEKFDDRDSEKGNIFSIEKKCSSTHKAKQCYTSSKKDKVFFRPLAVSHFISNCHEDNVEDNSLPSAIHGSNGSSIKASSEISKIANFPEADVSMNEGSHFQAINTPIPGKNVSESRESTSAEACLVTSDRGQYPPSLRNVLPHAPPSDLRQSPSHIGLSDVYISSIQNTDSETADSDWKENKDAATLLASVSRGNYLPDDEVSRIFSKNGVDLTLCQEISVDKSVCSKAGSQPSKSASVTVIPYSSRAKVDNQSDKACSKGKGNTVSSRKWEDFSARLKNQSKTQDTDIPLGAESQISASVNALTFFHTHSGSQKVSAMYKHLRDCCSQKSNQTDIPEKKIKDEIRIPVQSLTLDSLRSFGHTYGGEISLLYNLKEKLAKQVENIRKEGREKPNQLMKSVGETQSEQSNNETLGLKAQLKEDEKVINLCKNEKGILSPVEQKIKHNDGSDVDEQQRGKTLCQGFPTNLSEHHVESKETNKMTTKDNAVDESEGSISFPPFLHSASGIHIVDDQSAEAGRESESRVQVSMVKSEHQLESGEETFQSEKREDSNYRFSQCSSIPNKQKSTKKMRRAGRPVASCVINPQEHVEEAQDQMLISQNLSLDVTNSVAQIPSSLHEGDAGKPIGFWKNRTKKSVSPMSSCSEDSSASKDSTEGFALGRNCDKRFTSTAPKYLYLSHKHQNEQMQKRHRIKKAVPKPSFDSGSFAPSHLYRGQSQQHFHHHQHPLTEKQRVRSFHENSKPIETFPYVHPEYWCFSPVNPVAIPNLHFSGHSPPYGYSFCSNQPSYSHANIPRHQLRWPFIVPSQQFFHPSVFQNVSQMPSYSSLYINHMTKVTQLLNKKYFN